MSKFQRFVDADGRVSRSLTDEVEPVYPRRNCPRRSSFDPGVEVPIPISALLQRMTVFDCDPTVFAPTRVTFERLPLETFALYPMAVLFVPPVFPLSAEYPIEVLLFHWLFIKACTPCAVLFDQPLEFLSASTQTAVLNDPVLLFWCAH